MGVTISLQSTDTMSALHTDVNDWNVDNVTFWSECRLVGEKKITFYFYKIHKSAITGPKKTLRLS